MAAFEGMWRTGPRAPLYLFGIPDPSAEKIHFPIVIPGMLSFLIYGDPGAEVVGLDKFPDNEKPPVVLPFVSYHLMIVMGMAFIALGLAGIYLWARGKIWNARWFLKILVFSVPVPLLANEFGWIAAEVGRQPWAVYRVLRTADASSVVVPAGNILLTLILFVAVYVLIAAAGTEGHSGNDPQRAGRQERAPGRILTMGAGSGLQISLVLSRRSTPCRILRPGRLRPRDRVPFPLSWRKTGRKEKPSSGPSDRYGTATKSGS